MKRGLADIVSVGLMILLVVMGAGSVWVGVSSLIGSDFLVDMNDQELSVVTSGGYTFYDSDEEVACVQIERIDNSEKELVGAGVVFDFSGSSVTANLSFIVEGSRMIEVNQKRTYCFNLTGYGEPTSVSIYPVYSDGIGGVWGLSEFEEGQLSEEIAGGEVKGLTSGVADCEYEVKSGWEEIADVGCDSLRDSPKNCLDETSSGYLWAYPIFRNGPLDIFYKIDEVRFLWDVRPTASHQSELDFILDPDANVIVSKYLRPQSVDFCDANSDFKYDGSFDYDRLYAAMIQSGDDWFIRNEDGTPYDYCSDNTCTMESSCNRYLLPGKSYSYAHKYMLNVTVPSFQEWVSDEIVAYYLDETYKDDIPNDGGIDYGVEFSSISFDNLGYMSGIPVSGNEEVPEYFSEYLCEVKETLNDRGLVLAGNLGSSSWRVVNYTKVGKLSEFKEMMSCLDLVMDEYPLMDYREYPKVPLYYPNHWENSLDNYEIALDEGAGILFFSTSLRTNAVGNLADIVSREGTVLQSDINPCECEECLATEENTFKYLYASYMLIWRPQKCFFEFYNFCNSYTGTRITSHYEHPYLEFNLGDAIGSREQVDGVWVREFERGLVVVNPYLEDFDLELDDYYLGFDGVEYSDGEIVEIGSRSGIILKKVDC